MTALHKTGTYKPLSGWRTWWGHMPNSCLVHEHSMTKTYIATAKVVF